MYEKLSNSIRINYKYTILGFLTEGCNAYGQACYGGHGKRSLGSLTEEMLANSAYRNEREELHPNELLQAIPNEATGLLPEREIDTFPRYRLIKIMRSLVSLPKAAAHMLTYL